MKTHSITGKPVLNLLGLPDPNGSRRPIVVLETAMSQAFANAKPEHRCCGKCKCKR